MLLPASAIFGIAVAVHVIVVLGALGFVVAFPLSAISAQRRDPTRLPSLYRLRIRLGRALVNPGLLVILAAGVWATADHHLWKRFYVQWGIAAVVVLGGLEGALVIRQSKRLAELSERDVAAAAAGQGVTWSQEYLSLRARANQGAAAMALIVIATIVVMSVQ